MGTRLYVGNLPYAVTELDLRDLFGGIGTVTDAKIVTVPLLLARDGASVGIGMGQVNRVDSCRLAVSRAGDRAKGSVAAYESTNEPAWWS